ncbi:FAD-binding protein [Streptomyces sp. TRM 70351]|uniref:FAD-binding protein n=1 Tax=Streptomyces sp. TRM 70351 TaxID=3116552 RepID=UPI002E7B3C2F|nr:FAD-binding protein [Streptomyces sp. TRM 70351]MEE1928233.1 FAD-binding protein [Streptomyces sp. TRM 70351]
MKPTQAPAGDPALPHARDVLPARNWARNVTFRRERTARPASVAQLQDVVAASGSVRALGSGHSFNTAADTYGTQVSVSGLPPLCDIDSAAGTATLGAGLRFAQFTGRLDRAGFALHNLASLPHISLAGACATATHGSGTANPALSAAVRELELVTADGSLVTLRRGDDGFDGAVVSLGALGVVTRMTLDLRPAYRLRQYVYEGLPHRTLREHFTDVTGAAHSVSLFTDWRGEHIRQVWCKERADDGAPPPPRRWLGATLADGPRHPVPGMAPGPCTDQSGTPGPWHTLLPHFRAEFTPSSGDELQSEYFVASGDAVAAFDALDAVKRHIAPVLQICEIRTVAADEQWLSPAYRRDAVAFHFTWTADARRVLPVLPTVEAALAPFGARPHWGKLFTTPAAELERLHPRLGDFRALAARLDPAGTFRNAWSARTWLPPEAGQA